MSDSETLQKKINEHLNLYSLSANHDTHEIFEYGTKRGTYEIQEGDDNSDHNSVTVNFLDADDNIAFIPTLIVRF